MASLIISPVLLLLLLSSGLVQTSPLPNDATPSTDQRSSLGSSSSGTPRQFAVAIPELKQTSYQSFNDNGGYSFGYAFPDQMHTETRNADGEVTGSYFYVDPNGNSNQVQYRADKSGFRVTANNLPVYKDQPIQDTAEVAEAKQKHLAVWEAIANHNRAQADPAESRIDPQEEKGIVVEADESISVPVEVVDNKEVSSPVVELKAPPAAAPPSARKEDQPEQDYVAPLDLEPLPEWRAAPVAHQQADLDQSEPIMPPVEDNDAVVDEEKQAVSITDTQSSDQAQPALIEIDAEPIKLLAQLYGKHLQQQIAEAPEEIQRPEGFHPYNLEPPAGGFDLFSRSETADREAIDVINPEYVDLRAFLLTNRFRGDEDELGSSSSVPQIVLEAKDRVVPASSSYQNPAEYDLQTSGEDEPDHYLNVPISQALYNQYYNLPLDRPVFITRETFKDLPESLKMALLGVLALDGQHTAQAAPVRSSQKKKTGSGYYAGNYPSYAMKNVFSPYSSYYSPYYYYNSHRWNSNPYYSSGVYGYNYQPVRSSAYTATALPASAYYYSSKSNPYSYYYY